MNRSELVKRLAARHPQLQAKDVDFSVKMIFFAISRSLVNGGRVEIRGFGSFGLNYRPPRNGRNPKTGKHVTVPAKYTPHFRAGKELREKVNGCKVLGSVEMERLSHIELIEKEAEQVFGTSDLARDWLNRMNTSLGGTPLAMLDTEEGCREVRKVLSAISYGGVV